MNGVLVALRAPREEPDAVVVLRFSALGDVLLTAPAIDALHQAWPRARIVYAVKERFTHLVAHNPNVAQVMPLRAGEGPWSFAQRLRESLEGQRVVVLDLHGKIRSRLLRALLPRDWPRVVWHKRDLAQTIPVKLGMKPARASMLFADRYHLAVEKLAGRALPKGELRAFLGPGDRARAEGTAECACGEAARSASEAVCRAANGPAPRGGKARGSRRAGPEARHADHGRTQDRAAAV